MEEIEVLDFKEKKNKHIFLKILLIFIVLAIVGVVAGYNYLLSPVSDKKEEITFEVKSGLGVYSVGKILEDKKIIRSAFIYKIYVKLNNINEFKAGIYKLDKSYNTKEIVKLLSGNSYEKSDLKITFKEGKTIRGVAKTIEENTNIEESEFLSKLEDDSYIDSLINKYWFLTEDIKNPNIYYPLEGYLFPETYSFSMNPTVEEIITTMLDHSNKIFSKYKSQIDSLSLSINEVVTLASMIEKEGIYDNDRKMISGVFHNRLNKGMPMGSDVTTYYAFKIELGERDLTYKELNTYNPYNTRGPNMNGKLPVGAISNFGEESFSAAVEPEDNPYYYFVADKTGKTYFTKTYDEHVKKINEIKKAGNWIEF